jgi:hypothetical protein
VATTTVILHVPAHRRRALQIERDTAEAEQAYDEQIGAYVDFLRDEAEKAGYALVTDPRDADTPFGIEAPDGNAKRAVHDWLERQPDLWNWMP